MTNFRDQDVDYRGKVPATFEDWFAERNIRDDAPCEINSHTKKHWLPVAVRFVFFFVDLEKLLLFQGVKNFEIYIHWVVRYHVYILQLQYNIKSYSIT